MRCDATMNEMLEIVWARLEEHFAHHAALVRRFSQSDTTAVVEMWRTGTNELGEKLSQFEREALAERHCELTGRWPTAAERSYH
jgi:hypothetical protein